MIFIPILPLDTKSRELVDFCLGFLTVAGFVAVFEQTLSELVGEEAANRRKYIGAAYEATEHLHVELFGRRRYLGREVFYCALSNHRNG